MLRAASCLAPRSVYICGNTTTTSGLTVTVVREHGTGDYALEAGALVLGDRGVCCIDEFDKMGADHQALLEGMEQQSVSVAKAGLVCNLSARTTVLAAANPVSGHYDKAKTVCENLRMSAALLSRFDLVFVVLDRPDASQDRHISEHVMATFGGRTLARGNRQTRLPSWSPAAASSSPLEDVSADTAPDALHARLQRTRDYAREPLPPSLLRQFIRYARLHVHPRLGDEAKHVLRTFYLQLRRSARVHCHAHAGAGAGARPTGGCGQRPPRPGRGGGGAFLDAGRVQRRTWRGGFHPRRRHEPCRRSAPLRQGVASRVGASTELAVQRGCAEAGGAAHRPGVRRRLLRLCGYAQLAGLFAAARIPTVSTAEQRVRSHAS
eukprot:ctg_321.g96